ncbi:MAG: hypothetical protein M3Z27_09565 [Actinomycetota bacterium]|nr:hypothetical protein [Actinomycetota bacterium]
MNGSRDDREETTAAEQRLGEHLQLLRTDAPQAPALIVGRVIRSARWQRAVRRPLLAIGGLTATVGHALRLLLKPPAGHS